MINIKTHRQRKRLVNLLVVLITILAISVPAYSSILEKIGEAVEFAKNPVTAITDELITGTTNTFYKSGVGLGEALISGTVTAFGPDLSTFNNTLNHGVDEGDGIISGSEHSLHDSSKSVTDALDIAAKWFGMTLAFVLLVCGLLIFFFNKTIAEIKDTPFRLLGRFMIAAFFITCSNSIMSELLDVANNVWTKYITVLGDTSLSFEHFITFKIVDGAVTNMFGIALSAIPGVAPVMGIIMLVGLFLTWKLIKEYLKLFVEVVERYIVVCLLFYLAPAAAATMVNSNTTGIFKAYFKMFTAQLFLLFMNAFFVKTFILMLMTGNFTNSLMHFIFGLAFAKTAQRIDSYMASMGINVAQTGSNLLDSCGLGFGNLARGLSSANNARKGIANAGMQMATMGKGNQALYNGFKTMGATFDPRSNSSVSKLAADKASGGENNRREFQAKRAENANVKNSGVNNAMGAGQAQKRMAEALNGNMQGRQAWNGFSDGVKKNAVANTLSKMNTNGHVNVSSINDGKMEHVGVGFNANINGHDVTGTISNMRKPNSFDNGDGTFTHIDPSSVADKEFSVDNSPSFKKNENGEVEQIPNNNDLDSVAAITGTKTALDGLGKSGEDFRSNIASITPNDKGGATFKNDKGFTIGKMDSKGKIYMDAKNAAKASQNLTVFGQSKSFTANKTDEKNNISKDAKNAPKATPNTTAFGYNGKLRDGDAKHSRIDTDTMNKASQSLGFNIGKIENVNSNELTGQTTFEAPSKSDKGRMHSYTVSDIGNGAKIPRSGESAVFDSFGGYGKVAVTDNGAVKVEPPADVSLANNDNSGRNNIYDHNAEPFQNQRDTGIKTIKTLPNEPTPYIINDDFTQVRKNPDFDARTASRKVTVETKAVTESEYKRMKINVESTGRKFQGTRKPK